MADSGLSGLGASIRRAVDSETFDLAGKNASTIESAVRDAFEHPFPLAETIRLTFVTGAGKLARQKYDDGAAQAITRALRAFGYQDDQSGGAGTFKLQHDTGKNLKTVVVHPNVTGSDAGTGNGNNNMAGAMGGMSLDQQKAINSLIPEGTPEHKIAYASTNVFQRMIASMCPSWSQKKGCVAKIDDMKAMLKQLDEKLLTGTPLEDAEQHLYDSVSMTSLDEKQAHVRDLMHAQVEQSEITADERKLLMAQVNEKLAALVKDLAEAESQGKPAKRVETLQGALDKGKTRLEKIAKIAPKSLAKLKNEAPIIKLRTEMIPLAEIEASVTKGQLRSIKDTQAIARKEEMEQEIETLENASRGWFETDEEFAARIQASRAAWKPPSKKKKTPGGASGASGGSALSAKSSWATTTSSASSRARGKPASSSKPTAAAKSNKPKGGGVFAAMMMDSDSD